MVNALQSALGMVKHLLPVSTGGPFPLLPRLPDVPSFLSLLTSLLTGGKEAPPAQTVEPPRPEEQTAAPPANVQVVTAIELAQIREFLRRLDEAERGAPPRKPVEPPRLETSGEPRGVKVTKGEVPVAPREFLPAADPLVVARIQVPAPASAPVPREPEITSRPALIPAPAGPVPAVTVAGAGPETGRGGTRDLGAGRKSAGEEAWVQIVLEPPSLGMVEVELALHSDGLHAALRAGSIPARDAIAARLHVLRAALEKLSFPVRELRVDVDPAVAAPGPGRVSAPRSIDVTA